MKHEPGKSYRAFVSCLLLTLCSCLPMQGMAQSVGKPVIKVGLRSDARPFSYSGASDSNENVLQNYRGYMVEICRRVLRDMVSSGPFKGYRVEAVEVDPGNRFVDLANGKVDMLCGPDSITSSRLRNNNVSHPMFLSGMTYGYVNPSTALFPRSNYCGHIVGVAGGTTASTQGLKMLADQNLLLRFDKPLELYLAKYPALIKGIRQIIDNTRAANPTMDHDRIQRIRDPLFRKFQTSIKREIVTDECPNGFTGGLPVRKFKNHDDGIKAFCTGKVLYYIGDYDIIQRKIEAYGKCPVVLERFTSTREVYGVFFRKGFNEVVEDKDTDDYEADLAARDASDRTGPENRPATESLDPAGTALSHGTDAHLSAAGPVAESSSAPPGTPGSANPDTCQANCHGLNDPLFYAVFNHTLLTMMQANINILEYEFQREFGDSAKSEDLQEFFDSFKIVSDL